MRWVGGYVMQSCVNVWVGMVSEEMTEIGMRLVQGTDRSRGTGVALIPAENKCPS